MHYKKYFRKWRIRVVRWMTSSTKSKKHSMFVYFVLQCVHAGVGSLCIFFVVTHSHIRMCASSFAGFDKILTRKIRQNPLRTRQSARFGQCRKLGAIKVVQKSFLGRTPELTMSVVRSPLDDAKKLASLALAWHTHHSKCKGMCAPCRRPFLICMMASFTISVQAFQWINSPVTNTSHASFAGVNGTLDWINILVICSGKAARLQSTIGY